MQTSPSINGTEVHHDDYSAFSQAQIGLSLLLLPAEFQKLSKRLPRRTPERQLSFVLFRAICSIVVA